MTKINEKQVYSVTKEYDSLVQKIVEYVSQFEGDFTEIVYRDGSDGWGYFSHTVGDVDIRSTVDLSLFYYNGYSHLPKNIKKAVKEKIDYWKADMREERMEPDEYFEGADDKWAVVSVCCKIFDKECIDSDMRKEFADFDNVLVIDTWLVDYYGRGIVNCDEDLLVGINKDSNMEELFTIIKEEIDRRQAIVSENFIEG